MAHSTSWRLYEHWWFEGRKRNVSGIVIFKYSGNIIIVFVVIIITIIITTIVIIIFVNIIVIPFVIFIVIIIAIVIGNTLPSLSFPLLLLKLSWSS